MQNLVGHRIKALRTQRNLRQEEVADRLNIAPSTYAKIEQGKSKIDTVRLAELAKIFEVSVEELIPSGQEYHFNFHNNRVANGIVEHYYEAAREAHEQHTAQLMEIIRLLIARKPEQDILQHLEEWLKQRK